MKRVVLFSGGSACRSLNITLSRYPILLTRVVPAWDSGGSSKSIRENLGVLSVGDIRQALMTMAYGEGCSGDVIRLCNTRLSDDRQISEARREFSYYLEGRHPLLERLDAGLRGAIINYLKIFATCAGEMFDYRNGSIGNFILTGAGLAHNGDINTAIFVFRKLCGIEGNVWPSSLDNDLILSATLNNGQHISPQDKITQLPSAESRSGIQSIALRKANGNSASLNPAVLEAIKNADIIAFGPGSFYTSILPHLQVEGITEAIAAAKCRVAVIGNILQCRETRGMGLQQVADRFIAQWRQQDKTVPLPPLVILGNRQFLSIEKNLREFTYLNDAILDSLDYISILDEFEDVWERGKHDGEALAKRLMELTLAV